MYDCPYTVQRVNEEEIAATLRDIAQSPKNRCFVCGPGNPMGLRLRFERDGAVVSATFTPGRWHGGWQGVVHGGVLSAILDEAMAYTLFFNGVRAVTARMEVRYRHPVHAGDMVRVEAQIVRDARKLADVEGRIMRGDELMVEAVGRFVRLGELTAESLLSDEID